MSMKVLDESLFNSIIERATVGMARHKVQRLVSEAWGPTPPDSKEEFHEEANSADGVTHADDHQRK